MLARVAFTLFGLVRSIADISSHGIVSASYGEAADDTLGHIPRDPERIGAATIAQPHDPGLVDEKFANDGDAEPIKHRQFRAVEPDITFCRDFLFQRLLSEVHNARRFALEQRPRKQSKTIKNSFISSWFSIG